MPIRTQRTINKELLKKLINGRHTEVAFRSGCTEALIWALLGPKRQTAPHESYSRKMAEFLQCDHEVLFPWPKQEEKIAG